MIGNYPELEIYYFVHIVQVQVSLNTSCFVQKPLYC